MKNLIFCFIFIVSISANAQPAQAFTIDYEGYNLQVKSMAKDGNGNIVLVAKAQFKYDATKSPKELEDANYDTGKTGIILLTDEKFQIKNAWKHYNFYPANVVYNADKEQFWIGGSEQEYNAKRPELFSHFQMVLIHVDVKKPDRKLYTIETPYACSMDNLVLYDKKLLCTATKDTLSGPSRLETAMVFEFSPTKFHPSQYQPYIESAEILNVANAGQSAGHVMQTSVGFFKDQLLFGATAFPFGHIPTKSIGIYRYEKSKLTAEPFEPFTHSSFYYLTNFSVLKDGNYLLTYVTNPEKKFYIVEKTDRYLQTIWVKKVDDLRDAYLSNNVFEMPDGKIVAAAANKDQNWSYFIYSASGELVREIDTRQPVKSFISFVQPWSENEFACAFHTTEKKPVPNTIFIFKTQ